MKCKKIFAMLLALCMVLSTFVAVSASDIVVDISEDYESGIGDTLYGGVITLSTEEFEGENVLKATSSGGSSGWQGLVGFAVEDVNGNHLTQQALPAEGVIEYSFDIYVPAGQNVGDATCYLRTATGFPPAGMQTRLEELNGLATDKWITYSGTKNISDNSWAGDATDNLPVWLCFRPNFSGAGYFYLDNVSFKITEPSTDVGGDDNTGDDNTGDDNTGDDNTGDDDTTGDVVDYTYTVKKAFNAVGTLENDVFTSKLKEIRDYTVATYGDATDNYGMNCSYQPWVYIDMETPIPTTEDWKVLYDLTSEDIINSIGQAYSTLTVRTRFYNESGSEINSSYRPNQSIEVNTGAPVTFELDVDETQLSQPVARIGFVLDVGSSVKVNTYADSDAYFEIGNIFVGDVNDERPAGDDNTGDDNTGDDNTGDDNTGDNTGLTYTIARTVNNGTMNGNPYNAVGAVVDGVYTATLKNVREYTESRYPGAPDNYGMDCSYQPWVSVIFDEVVPDDVDLVVSYDLTTEGILNSIGAEYAELTVRTRFYNEDDSEINSSYRPTQTIAVNTGAPVAFELDVDETQLSQPVKRVGLVVDVGTSVKFNTYADSDAYFEISNIFVGDINDKPAGDDNTGDDNTGDDPVVDENAIAFTTEAVGPTIESNGVYKITAADVHEKVEQGAANPYTGYVRLIPDTPIAKDAEWTLSYDLTTDGIVDADNKADIWVRLLDNTTSASQGKTVGYAKNTATLDDGTVTYTFTSDTVAAGGGTSTSETIAAMNITFDFGQIWAAYDDEANDGYIEISNIKLVSGLPSEGGEGGEEGGEDPIVPPTPGDDTVTYETVIDMNLSLEDASELTHIGKNVTVEAADGKIGDRLGVSKASGVANNNDSTVGVKIGDDFAFMPGDKIYYSVDIYADHAITPNLWLRRHTGDMEPFNSNFKPAVGSIPANTWYTIEYSSEYDKFGTYTPAKAPEGWSTKGTYALYLRADLGTIYLDNFKIKVEREFVPTITEVTESSLGAESATVNVVTTGAINVDSLKNYCEIDGVKVDASRITVEKVDDLNTLVTIGGLAPNTEYEIAVTGAKNVRNRDVKVESEADATVSVTTIAEVDMTAELEGETLSFSLTNNKSGKETIYAVLLRCKGNTVIETTMVEGHEIVAGDTKAVMTEVEEATDGEYYRFFAWSYENGSIYSLADFIELD